MLETEDWEAAFNIPFQYLWQPTKTSDNREKSTQFPLKSIEAINSRLNSNRELALSTPSSCHTFQIQSGSSFLWTKRFDTSENVFFTRARSRTRNCREKSWNFIFVDECERKTFLSEKSPRWGSAKAKINIASRNLALVRYCLIKFV